MPKALSPEAVLSKALTRASAATEAGVWEVGEYSDTIYRVRRDEDGKHIQVEAAR